MRFLKQRLKSSACSARSRAPHAASRTSTSSPLSGWVVRSTSCSSLAIARRVRSRRWRLPRPCAGATGGATSAPAPWAEPKPRRTSGVYVTAERPALRQARSERLLARHFGRRHETQRAPEALAPELRVLEVVQRALHEALRPLPVAVVPALVGAHHVLAQLLELDLAEVLVHV